MINETEAVKENARTVDSMGVPQLPMLLFLSNGSGGTGFDTEARREIPISYLSQARIMFTITSTKQFPKP